MGLPRSFKQMLNSHPILEARDAPLSRADPFQEAVGDTGHRVDPSILTGSIACSVQGKEALGFPSTVQKLETRDVIRCVVSQN